MSECLCGYFSAFVFPFQPGRALFVSKPSGIGFVQFNSSITTQTVQKAHISSVTADLNIRREGRERVLGFNQECIEEDILSPFSHIKDTTTGSARALEVR